MVGRKIDLYKIKLKDINVCKTGPHFAEHRVNGVWKKWIGRTELENIVTEPLREFIDEKTQEVKGTVNVASNKRK
tara:strand:- start:400 stop:624 length:225 start_codon:yes stop_codon:yes gene_type:complete